MDLALFTFHQTYKIMIVHDIDMTLDNNSGGSLQYFLPWGACFFFVCLFFFAGNCN